MPFVSITRLRVRAYRYLAVLREDYAFYRCLTGDGKYLAEARLAGNDGRLRGWAYRTRTGESVGELSD
jgi:hypothetical protein